MLDKDLWIAEDALGFVQVQMRDDTLFVLRLEAEELRELFTSTALQFLLHLSSQLILPICSKLFRSSPASTSCPPASPVYSF